jgi:hypothetical protein
MTRPSPEELLSEAAQIAYLLHWPLDAILDLEHGDRRLFLRYAHAMAGVTAGEEAAAYGEAQAELPPEYYFPPE